MPTYNGTRITKDQIRELLNPTQKKETSLSTMVQLNVNGNGNNINQAAKMESF